MHAVGERALPFPRSFDSRLELKSIWSVCLKSLLFDVVIKTFCVQINDGCCHEKKRQAAVVNGVANRSPAPALTALNTFNALN